MTLETFSTTWISPIRNTTAAMITGFFDTITGVGPAKGTRHNALDISVPVGTPIFAPRDAKVKDIQFQPGSGGHMLILEHSGGYETVYAHLSDILVSIGDDVRQGAEVARSGDSGFVTGPHLHWEVKRNGAGIDPLDIFDPFDDVPDSIYQELAGPLIAFLEETLSDDIKQEKTWGEWVSKSFPFGFWGTSPFKSSQRIENAIISLGWEDKKINPNDIPTLINEYLDLEAANKDPLETAGDVLANAASAIGFLIDPGNWARVLALVAGGALAFVGFRIMWEASNS